MKIEKQYIYHRHIYYHRTFLLYQNNVRKTWSVIKETLQRKKKHEMPGEFVWNNRVITDMTDIANEFNRYFIIIIIKYQIYIALISNKCSEALNSTT